MQSAAQLARSPRSYPLGVRLADLFVGGAATFEIVVAGVLLGGASSLTPWLLFSAPIFFAAGFSRGARPGSSWRKTAIMSCAAAMFLLLTAGIVTALLGACYAGILIAAGVAARNRTAGEGRRAKTLIFLGNALPFVVLAGIIALWYSYLNQTNGSLVSSGMRRRYLLYVPTTYSAAKPAPLVISLHPAGSWPVAERAITGWNRVADERGFLVVYPAGRSFPQIWPNSPVAAEQDVRFISDLIDRIEAEYNVDASRVFIDGISNGGGMTFTISCRLSHRIAAMGVVAAAQTLTWDWCGNAAPLPVMTFHGTADKFVPYRGGTSIVSNGVAFPDVRQWVSQWARRNQCSGPAVEMPAAASVRRLSYANCSNNADVVLYTVDGGGHTWPGGGFMPPWIVGRTARDLNATRLLWDFYRQHPRPSK